MAIFAASTWAAASVVGSVYSSYSSGKAQQESQEANNAYAQAQYQIDVQHNTALNAYADEQQAFAYTQQAYSNSVYAQAVADRAAEVAYRQKQVADTKNAAITDYKAQGHVANIMIGGAENQAKAVTEDVLRATGATKREAVVASNKMMGTAIAIGRSGLAQGRSKDRLVADAYIQRNKQLGQMNNKAKGSILQTIQAKDKVSNDYALKLGESYRGLQATMKLEAAPVANIAPPAPVFTGRAPVQPVGPNPGSGTTISNSSILGNTLASGVGAYVSSGLGSTTTGATTPNYASDNGWLY